MVKTSQIINFLENSFTDISHQSSWDFSGRQVYTGSKNISKIAFSLDPVKETVIKAINEGCELLITHHPLFFHAKKGINIDNLNDEVAIIAIQNNLDILSYHTNLDMAENGLNDYICSRLGFWHNNDILSIEGNIEIYKFSVFVPYDYKDKVFDAIVKAGAGKAGSNYEGCGFISEGLGTFTPVNNAEPFIGKLNEPAYVDEVKIETVVNKKDISKVLQALKESHPYEEPAYDIIKLEQSVPYGFGRICSMDKKWQLKNFIAHIQKTLNIKNLRSNMQNIEDFDKFAICTGSGASLWKDAVKKGIKVLVTGDLKYHDAQDAAANGVCVIDAGHQETEEIYMEYLAEIIKEKFNIDVKVFKQSQQIIYWGN